MNKVKGILVLILVVGICLGIFSEAMAARTSNLQIRRGKVYLNLKDADIKSVLQIFAKATNTNIVASDDVEGKITVTFTGIAPKKGLEAVLRTKGLDWFEEEGTIYVSTKKIMRTYYLESARPSDIESIVKNILPDGSTVSVDDSYNVLVVQTTSDYLPRLERLIKELDVPPTQVMIEVRMIELRHTDGGKTGSDIKYTSSSDPNDVVETKGFAEKSNADDPEGIYAHVLSGNIEAYLSALKTAVSYNTVATPRLTTLSNKEASLLIGQKLGYKTTVITETTTTQEINFLEVGTSLSITPLVTKGGYIRMSIEPKLSDGTIVNELPQENTTETKNEVMVKDGQTFVIGGLMKDKDTQTDYGIPFVMDIPLIGAFFRRSVISKEKQELIVFVTPHILTASNLEALSRSHIKEMEEKSAREKAKLIR
ncbi:MAG: secretin N-terminal domain-containing protein [Candidatus Margulisiibacteriota bacterium]|nr:secretin N-terminal domain-containing protein [Candidatus Margulisiibacteriota bacterium]